MSSIILYVNTKCLLSLNRQITSNQQQPLATVVRNHFKVIKFYI